MSVGNNWLARQRKADLVDLAGAIGLTNYEKLLKAELEAAIDDYVSTNLAIFQTNPKLRDYFKSRARAEGSPVKKEPLAYEPKLSKRRQSTKLAEEVVVDPSPATSSSPSAAAADEGEEEEEEDDHENESSRVSNALTTLVPSSAQAALATPGRALSRVASRIQLPTTPADVAQAVESSTLAVRSKISDLYSDSGLPEATQSTREFLSTVHSVLSTIALFELYKLRQELLPDRYAFTFPAVSWLGTGEYPVRLPDMFALVTSSFWVPALTWAFTSLLVPGLVGYFYNLSGVQQQQRGKRGGGGGYEVDPLVFSVVKAILTYVVYAQGVTFGGLIPGGDETVGRINGALYSGWKGVLVGTAVGGLVSVYDAVLRK